MPVARGLSALVVAQLAGVAPAQAQQFDVPPSAINPLGNSASDGVRSWHLADERAQFRMSDADHRRLDRSLALPRGPIADCS